jgi:hypothetical protein
MSEVWWACMWFSGYLSIYPRCPKEISGKYLNTQKTTCRPTILLTSLYVLKTTGDVPSKQTVLVLAVYYWSPVVFSTYNDVRSMVGLHVNAQIAHEKALCNILIIPC